VLVPSIVIGFLRVHRTQVLILLDASAWVLALYFASAARLETWAISSHLHVATANGRTPLGGLLVVAGIATATHVIVAWRLRLHQGRSITGSFDEIFLLASVLAFAGLAAAAVNVGATSPFLARTTPVMATCLALILSAWPRGLWRVLIHDARPDADGSVSTPVIIAGAGDAGRQLVKSMLRDEAQQWRPLGFVDDNLGKRHFRYQGVPTLGTVADLEQAAAQVGADTVIIAMPAAGAEATTRVYEKAKAAGLTIKVLPGIADLLGGVDASAVRDIQPEDLLGRQPIETDIASISGYLAGKRVLVTGAGGSIGSELCRQISAFGPAELLMLDRDESALHALLLSLRGRADLESPDVILANIRDAERMQEVFETRRPHVVFHAAALKHVNMLENAAAEAVKTNVLGTLNVLESAAATSVERFVNISTDKAADAENVLGYTKRIAEGLTASVSTASDGTYLSVRFGNVLGTSGSVLKTFAAQIEAGGPVTVTDPEVTRYFMTVHEAIQLVIQAAAIGRDGEALVLDMGEPVRILDVAQQMIDQSQQSIDIVFTGLKHGEKLHEVLLGDGEVDHRPIHPLLAHVPVPTVVPHAATSLPRGRDNLEVVNALEALCRQMRSRLHHEARV
jgi:FlaA1/EpsC-like NDP-sugar epimerase